MWPFWSKNGRVPEKNFQREIFFEINFFGLEYVLKHSESILKKKFKNFGRKFSLLVIFDHFLTVFGHFRNFQFRKLKKQEPSRFHSLLREAVRVHYGHLRRFGDVLRGVLAFSLNRLT